jgi:hypothetical protein
MFSINNLFFIRGQRVMLDSDLAKLYGVETKVLNQAVKRNFSRFPEDFLMKPNLSDLADLRSQIVTLGLLSHGNNIFKHPPFLFTENGIAMLSSVLNSERAIQVNISIMRTFTKIRNYSMMDVSIKDEVGELKKNTNHLFKIVFERFDNLEEIITPKVSPSRKKIGIKPNEN